MRNVKTPQLHLGEVDISDIQVNPYSCDDIPAIPQRNTVHLYP